ncbi:peptidyl-tRNA hydrolase domain-containing protein, partial [Eremomyces bilateralis CBS 781.70]
KPLPPKPTVDDNDLIENFLRGSGPGGQKINKTTSAVQLIHIPTGLVVKSQDTRSRSQNRVIARKRLAEALDEREHGEASRSAIKRDRQSKKKSSRAKKSRRKYRKLEEEKSRQEGGAAVGEEDGD